MFAFVDYDNKFVLFSLYPNHAVLAIYELYSIFLLAPKWLSTVTDKGHPPPPIAAIPLTARGSR